MKEFNLMIPKQGNIKYVQITQAQHAGPNLFKLLYCSNSSSISRLFQKIQTVSKSLIESKSFKNSSIANYLGYERIIKSSKLLEEIEQSYFKLKQDKTTTRHFHYE